MTNQGCDRNDNATCEKVTQFEKENRNRAEEEADGCQAECETWSFLQNRNKQKKPMKNH